MIPGLPMVPGGGGSYSIRYSSSTTDVNLFEDMGSPPGPVDVTVVIDSGVTIGSSDPANAAFYIAGFANGSRFFITNNGTIAGAGGAGGGGDRGRRDNSSGSRFVGGGGGGGAGSNVGSGGLAPSPSYSATNGSDGTATTGGAAGSNYFDGSVPVGGYTAGTPPEDGGFGFYAYSPIGFTRWTLYFENNGQIYSGAAGGIGGRQTGSWPGGEELPAAGSDLPTFATVMTTGDPRAAFKTTTFVSTYRTGTWTYPSIRGFIAVPTDL